MLPLKTKEPDKERDERKREKITMATETSNTFICDYQKLRPLISLKFDIKERNHELVIMTEEFRTSIEIEEFLELKIDNVDSPCPLFGEELEYTVLKFNRELFINRMKDSMMELVKDNFLTGEMETTHVDGWKNREEGIDMILKDSTVHAVIHDESEQINTTNDLRMAFERSYTAFKDRKRFIPNNNSALIYPDLTFALGIQKIYPRHDQFYPRNLFCYTHHCMKSQIDASYDPKYLQVASDYDSIIGDNKNNPIVANVVLSSVASLTSTTQRLSSAVSSSTVAVPVEATGSTSRTAVALLSLSMSESARGQLSACDQSSARARLDTESTRTKNRKQAPTDSNLCTGTRLWTEDQEKILLQMKSISGTTWPKISSEIGKTVLACKSKYNKLKRAADTATAPVTVAAAVADTGVDTTLPKKRRGRPPLIESDEDREKKRKARTSYQTDWARKRAKEAREAKAIIQSLVSNWK